MKKFFSKNAFFVSAGVFLLLAILFSMAVYSTFYDWGARSGDVYQPEDTPIYNALGTPIATDGSPLEPTQPAVSKPIEVYEPEPWDGTKRVTLLLMGVDYRDWEAQNVNSRTDTMILLTIDPVEMTAGVLSIPRDLWAAIPGFNPAKINTAHYFGDLYNYPGGGPALAVKTVENVIGVHIDYYARLDFDTFVDFIDAIYGVPVTITETIELEIIGQAHDEVYEPGYYVLDGKLALAYARNRYNTGGDFDRSRRQQQVIMGIRQRLTTPRIWAALIAQAPELYDRFKDGITTNLPFEDAMRLAALAVRIPEENITMAVINEQYVEFGTSPDGLSILIPLPDRIRVLRDKIFATSGGAFTPMLQGDALVRMQAEQPRVIIYDGTNDNTTAQRTADYLTSLGVNVVSIQPADQVYTYTSLTDHTGNPYTMRYLADLMGVGTYSIFNELTLNATSDVEIVLGTQWQYNNSLP